jgi:hypothetical protein
MVEVKAVSLEILLVSFQARSQSLGVPIGIVTSLRPSEHTAKLENR